MERRRKFSPSGSSPGGGFQLQALELKFHPFGFSSSHIALVSLWELEEELRLVRGSWQVPSIQVRV